MLFNVLKPHALCVDLGLRKVENQRHVPAFQDPVNEGNTILTVADEFVSQTYNPDYQYGNIIDLLVYVKGFNYEDAISHVTENYKDSIDATLLSSIDWWKKDTASYLEDLATVNRYIAKASKDLKIPAKVREELNNRELLQAGSPQFLVYSQGAKVNAMLGELCSKEFNSVKHTLANEGHYLLYPYYTNYHTLSALIAEEVPSGKFIAVYESELSYGYLGYHTINPELHVATFCSDILELARTRNTFLSHSRNKFGTLLLRYNTRKKQKRAGIMGAIQPDKLPRLVIHKDKCKVLANLMKYFKYASEVKSSEDLYFQTYKNSKCCRSKIVNSFFSMLSKNSEEEELSKFMSYAFKDAIIRSEVLEKLKHSGRDDIVTLADHEVLRVNKKFNSLGKQVESTAAGYAIDIDGESVPITNFTIMLKRTLVFQNSSDVFYSGSVYLQDLSKDITFSKRTLQQPYQLLKVITKAVTEDSNSDVRLPMIYDQSYTKYLNNILLQEANTSKAEFGMSRLGWSDDRSTFKSFSWEASNFEVTETTAIPHPERPLFDNYIYHKLPDSNKVKFSKDINLILSMLVGMLCRSYLRWDIPTVKIYDTPKSRKLLLQLFETFGQNKLIFLNTNRRTSVNKYEEFNGYPIITVSSENPQKYSVNGIFHLTMEGGTNIDKFNDDYEFSTYFKVLIPKLVTYILRSRCEDYVKVGNTPECLAAEGSSFIKAALDLKEFDYKDSNLEVVDGELNRPAV